MNRNHSVDSMNPSLTLHLRSTSVITAWCHLEEEGGSLFLKPDLFKEQVPKLSTDEKHSVQAMGSLFETNL